MALDCLVTVKLVLLVQSLQLHLKINLQLFDELGLVLLLITALLIPLHCLGKSGLHLHHKLVVGCVTIASGL